MRELLGAPTPKIEGDKPDFVPASMSPMMEALMANKVKKFKNIMLKGENGCAQLNYCFANQAEIDEPLWMSALSIPAFCTDGDKAAHKMSDQHPEYDPAEVDNKLRNIRKRGGPHHCTTFEERNPGGCDGCPHKGQITSPIVLGIEIEAAQEADNEVVVETEAGETKYQIPEYPFPFFRGKRGGVYVRSGEEEEAEPKLVYEHDLYVVKRMKDKELGEIALFRLHLPHDGVKEFSVTTAAISSKDELRKQLAQQGVMAHHKQYENLATYVVTAVKNLQYTKKAETMRTQFGWVENDSKFIMGNKEITKDGTFYSPSSSTTEFFAEKIHVKGDMDKWKEVFNLYAIKGMEPHAFGALTAFGSPLMKFTGLKGAIINVIYKHGGSGKSTTLFMCNSVYGHPEALGSIWKDTNNAKMQRLGVMNNLPYTVDEITNISAEDFSDLAYGMSQGRGKDRMKGSTNELRENTTTWQTMSLASANASFYEKLSSAKVGANAEMLRLFEYEIAPNNVISTEDGKRLFDRQLKENYGHAGDIYIQWLVNNLDEASKTILNIQAKIDTELRLTPPERFWSATAACNIAGGLIAKSLGLHDYDMRAIYLWACKEIQSMRSEIKPPAEDASGVIGDYINRHMQNILVVKADNDSRTTVASLPTLEPRGELLIRYEPDTKHMYFVTREFRADCVERQINYKNTLAELKRRGFFKEAVNKRMSKGMKLSSPAVNTLMFDCSDSTFLDMDGIVGSEIKNASREA
jgi:hypothetical protein